MKVKVGWTVIVSYYSDIITVDVLDEKDNLTEIAELQAYCKTLVDSNPTKFNADFIKSVIERKYVYGIPLKYKLRRLPKLLRNLYRFIVDESYR